MSDLNRGDLVSLSRSQISQVTVDTLGGPGTVHTITLPLNPPATRSFSYTEEAGDGTDDVALGLEVALLSRPGQSVYSVSTGPGADELTIVGPLGVDFEVTVSALLTTLQLANAVSAQDSDGVQIGLLRVVQSESNSLKLRSYATRTRDGVVVELEDVLLRELGSSRLFDVQRTEILTIIERANDPVRVRSPA